MSSALYEMGGVGCTEEISAAVEDVEQKMDSITDKAKNGADISKEITVKVSMLKQDALNYHSPFPFSGGAVGFLSYDLKNEIESLPNGTSDDLNLPLWRFAWYDGIVIYDHFQEKYWITACGIKLKPCLGF